MMIRDTANPAFLPVSDGCCGFVRLVADPGVS